MNKIDINKLTIEEKIGQMIGLAFYGAKFSEELRMQIEDFKVGLVILFKDNCLNPKQIFNLNKEINKHAAIPPFISLDQEGGMVARVTKGIVQSPGAMAISAGSSLDDTYHLAYNMGKELVKLGFNFNFAPDADVNNNPANPVINVRSYSEKPQVVADYMLAATKGYNDAGMMTSAKHFPGHGDTAVDSHLGLPIVDFDVERLEKVELVPFVEGIKHNNPGFMASHVMYTKIDDEYPATLSNKIIQKFLREHLGYDGLVVTDSLTMKAVWGRYGMEEVVYRTFNSGCDIMLLCGARDINMQKEFYNTAVRLAKEGKIDHKLIDNSVRRILKYKEIYCQEMADDFSDIEKDLLNKESIALSKEVMNRAVTLFKDENKLLPINKEDKVLVVFPIIKVVTLVENSDNTLNSLAEYLPFKVDKTYISLEVTDEEINKVLELIPNYNKIIFCSYNAGMYLKQKELADKIEANKLIICALRTPYDCDILKASTYITAYEASELSFEALALALIGKIKPTGKCPVTINIK